MIMEYRPRSWRSNWITGRDASGDWTKLRELGAEYSMDPNPSGNYKIFWKMDNWSARHWINSITPWHCGDLHTSRQQQIISLLKNIEIHSSLYMLVRRSVMCIGSIPAGAEQQISLYTQTQEQQMLVKLSAADTDWQKPM